MTYGNAKLIVNAIKQCASLLQYMPGYCIVSHYIVSFNINQVILAYILRIEIPHTLRPMLLLFIIVVGYLSPK